MGPREDGDNKTERRRVYRNKSPEKMVSVGKRTRREKASKVGNG